MKTRWIDYRTESPPWELEISHTIEAVKKADDRIDTAWNVDEAQIIAKLQNTYDKFINLRDRIAWDEDIPWAELRENLDALERNFFMSLAHIRERLEGIQTEHAEQYAAMIRDLADEHWGIVRAADSENIREVVLSGIDDPDVLSHIVEEWDQFDRWVRETQEVPEYAKNSETLISMLPAELVGMRHLAPYADVIDIASVLQGGLGFTDAFDTLSVHDPEKGRVVYEALGNYFLAQGDLHKARILHRSAIHAGYEMKSEVRSDFVPRLAGMQIESGDSGPDSNMFTNALLQLQAQGSCSSRCDGPQYDGFFGFFEWLGDGLYDGMVRQFTSYAGLFEGLDFGVIEDLIALITSDPWTIIETMGQAFWDQIVEFWEELARGYPTGENLGRGIVNQIIGLLFGGVGVAGGALLRSISTLCPRLARASWALVSGAGAVEKIWLGIQKATGAHYMILRPSDITGLPKTVQEFVLNSWNAALSPRELWKLTHDALAFAKNNTLYLAYSAVDDIASIVRSPETMEVLRNLGDMVSIMTTGDGRAILSIDTARVRAALTDPEFTGAAGLWIRRTFVDPGLSEDEMDAHIQTMLAGLFGDSSTA